MLCIDKRIGHLTSLATRRFRYEISCMTMVKKIISEIYDTPFIHYKQDSTKVMKTEAEVEKFLVETFKSLEEKNYGQSIINGWESYKKDEDIIIMEMNFTRFSKDGKVMGEEERTASYIIRKKDKGYKILAVIPHVKR